MKLSKQNIYKLTVLVIFVLITLYLFKIGVSTKRGLDLIKHPHNWLQATVDQNYYFAYGLFIITSIGLAIISFPVIIFCTILGGYLFGFVDGFIANYIIDVIGAIGAYWVNRFVYGQVRFKNAPQRLQYIYKGFTETGATWYLLIIRVFGVIPYVLVNIISGIMKLNFRVFVIMTMIGVIPLGAVYTYLGHAMANALSRHEDPMVLASSQMLWLSLIGLVILLLIRLVIMSIMKRRASH